MALGSIYKETGRATYEEIERLRKRLDIVEAFRGSLTQSLAATGSGTGPVGSYAANDLRYLRLNAGNDPLTGSLETLAITLNSGDLTVASGNGVITAGNLTLAAGQVSVSNTAKGINVNVTTTDSAVNINTNGSAVPTLSPDAVTNAANNLLMWFEADTLGLSDGADVQTWTQSSGGLSTDLLLQGTASVAPHYRTGETPEGKPGVIAEVTGHRMSKSEVDGIHWKYGVDQGGGTDVNSCFIVVYRTDDLAASNNILTMGNEDSAGVKESFRPVGNSALGNSYVYGNNTLYQVGTGHAGHAGGTWHVAMFWHDATNDNNRVWIDGTNYDNGPLVQDLDMDVDVLFRDVGGGTEGVAVGTGVAAMVLIASNGGGGQISLDEAKKVHDFIALEYMGTGYTIAAAGTAGDLLTLQVSAVTKSVFDETGQLHIGGSDPAVALDVEGDANISGLITIGTTAAITGQLTAGSLNVTGLSTLSGVDAGASRVDSLTVDGLLAVNDSTVTIVGTAGPSLHMTGPGPNFAWIEDNHTTQSDWRMRLNAGQLEWRDNVGISGINTVITFEPGAPTDQWTFRADGNIVCDGDNDGILMGEGGDASIDYNGINLVLKPKRVGSGHVDIRGTLEKEEQVVSKAADYTVLSYDNYVLVTAACTITLPAPSNLSQHTIKSLTTNTVLIVGNAGETIDDLLTLTVSSKYEAIKVVTDGTNWYIV